MKSTSRRKMRLTHELDQIEAKLLSMWRANVRLMLGFSVACAGAAALLLYVGVSPVFVLFVVGLSFGELAALVLHTCRLRRILGVWPWRLGR